MLRPLILLVAGCGASVVADTIALPELDGRPAGGSVDAPGPDDSVSAWYEWAGGPVADWYDAPEAAFVDVSTRPTIEDWYGQAEEEDREQEAATLSPEQRRLNGAIGDAVKVIRAAEAAQRLRATTATAPTRRSTKRRNTFKQTKRPAISRVELEPRAGAALAVAGPADYESGGADEDVFAWYDLPHYGGAWPVDAQLPVDHDTGGLVTKCSIGVGYGCGKSRADADPYKVCTCARGTECSGGTCVALSSSAGHPTQTTEIVIDEVFLADARHPDGGQLVAKVPVEQLRALPARESAAGAAGGGKVETVGELPSRRAGTTEGTATEAAPTTSASSPPEDDIIYVEEDPAPARCTLRLGDTCNARFLPHEQWGCACGRGLKCGRLVCITDRAGGNRASLPADAGRTVQRRGRAGHSASAQGSACVIAEGRSCRYFGPNSSCRCADGLQCAGGFCVRRA